ncbi:LOW QUALITY PROTEIN: hypothetical protein IFM46972_10670 [Aspergillus udagawae]|uniref:Uncharacterized protein n=1 Tax=Aspergillus udagawae TaxID=91492 RepID=A0A8H3SDZ1_9EURO|nr:LOW QUALITY PROTEIN: hypothetical protein IFM46972_10670 [Aspergillus udagawae]
MAEEHRRPQLYSKITKSMRRHRTCAIVAAPTSATATCAAQLHAQLLKSPLCSREPQPKLFESVTGGSTSSSTHCVKRGHHLWQFPEPAAKALDFAVTMFWGPSK